MAGAAFFAGEVSADRALVVCSFVDEAAHLVQGGRIEVGEVRRLEETLSGYARVEPPEFLRRIGARAVNVLDPDGQEPTEGELLSRQGIFFRRPRRGLIGFDGHMTIVQYEKLMSSVAWAANPNKHKDPTPGSKPSAGTGPTNNPHSSSSSSSSTSSSSSSSTSSSSSSSS
ncbi:hypothetical protein, partial [Microbacterium pseudoresistens]|uniref:hypothetical protein n=1 Tax=Microbacterium pseudoresistens TaxID=640634 RepID=UPI0031EB3142